MYVPLHLVVVDPVGSVRELNLNQRSRSPDTLFEVLRDGHPCQIEKTDVA